VGAPTPDWRAAQAARPAPGYADFSRQLGARGLQSADSRCCLASGFPRRCTGYCTGHCTGRWWALP